MTSDVARILAEGESEASEFKSPRAPLSAVGKDVCGMLNQKGGVLLWGVDDQGRAIGMEDAERRQKELNDFLIRHLNPRPLLSVAVLNVGNKKLLGVHVPQGADKPYSLDREIWVRIGTTTLRASEEASADIVDESVGQLERWERAPMPGFGIEHCDTSELARARAEIADVGRFGVDLPSTGQELLRRLFLLRSGQLTNASVVLFARSPREWAPNLAVRIVSYRADKTGPIGNDTILEGPAIRVLKEAVGIIQQRTGFSGRFDKGKLEREDRPAYHLYALREGLVNAMVHRDYGSIGGDVRIEVFSEHLTIHNPGTLPDGWSTEDLAKVHESRPTNPDIARVFYLRGYMDQLGMGTQRLIAVCKQIGAKTPVWHVERDTVSLKLFRAPEPEATAQLPDRQLRFLKSTKAGTEFKVGDYANAAKVSERQSRRDLADLESLGLVERSGKGPATHYTRTSQSWT
ncbi:MAG TPA: RNA-binding domain-containing protein [Blastocatellia bacterium]|nr:RNA-binding domain-containing protein [Blastocatellia bacterium]